MLGAATEDNIVDLTSLWCSALSFTAADGLPILLYHKVGDYPPGAAMRAQYVPPARFRAQMSLLSHSGYRTVGLDDVLRYLRGERLGVERPIAITFDDGYDCLYYHAFPTLREFGFEAVVFMVAGRIGGTNDWETPPAKTPEPMLTRHHAAAMSRAGVEFGSHGMTHPAMTRLTGDELRRELTDSKRVLEQVTGREVRAVAYPFGDYDDRVRAAAADAGYAIGFTTRRGVNHVRADPLTLRRINIRRYTYAPLFARKLRRAYSMAGRRA
jgi:peptidoglycan/xylan/chitin deacetylase (PgdA/CDA1 family)